MAYVALSEVTTYGGHDSDFDSDNVDYDLLSSLLDRAQSFLENYTGRIFAVSSTSTRKFDAVEDVDGLLLFLDEDLVVDTDLAITNGDGNAVASSDVVYEPRNTNPRWGIRIKGSAGTYWKEDTVGDAENAISIVGSWGYSATAPDDIQHALIRLTRWLYKQRNAPFDVDAPVVTPEGSMILPAQIPKDVIAVLNHYKKVHA